MPLAEDKKVSRWVVGLTGGIGSGKTAVSDTLQQLGAAVVDTDRIAHNLTAPGGAAIESIRKQFGPGSIEHDGRMNRAYMRELVFEKPSARKELESILHPMIRDHAIEALSQGEAPYWVLVVPLLAEKGIWTDLMNNILVVDCDVETQVARVKARNGWPEAQIRAIIASQASREQRLALATHVLVNDQEIEKLEAEIKKLHDEFIKNSSK